jgi:hypothetical protein
MTAYSMIEPNAVFYQEDDKNELDVMFAVAQMTPEEVWRTRLGESARPEGGTCAALWAAGPVLSVCAMCCEAQQGLSEREGAALGTRPRCRSVLLAAQRWASQNGADQTRQLPVLYGCKLWYHPH